MATTPTVARFHNSAASSSATDTLKLVRNRSFMLRTTWRRSLTDCAASMWSSRVRKAMGMRFRVSGFEFRTNSNPAGCRESWKPETGNSKLLRVHFGCNPLGGEGFNYVAGLDVAIVRDRDAALHTVGDFLGIVFEASQRSDLAFEHDNIVTQQAHFGVAFDNSIGNAATGNRSNFGDAEGFEHLGASLVSFLDGRFEQPAHGAL